MEKFHLALPPPINFTPARLEEGNAGAEEEEEAGRVMRETTNRGFGGFFPLRMHHWCIQMQGRELKY